jgi:glycerol-3-phosphate dehydrogenase
MTDLPRTAPGTEANPYDLLVIGGGINGAGIARDAVGRGYSVCLAESGDFGSGTSSASTKLFHGGLRYLEYFEFRLVREALIEREILLKAMPHISWPMRFVLPYHEDMRFEGETPTSKLLSITMPWLKGRRPSWLIRLGLLMYDNLGGRKILPPTRTLDLAHDAAGKPLKKKFKKAYEYSDCWVQDSRLVVLNLRDAQKRGADINRSTAATKAEFADGLWRVTLRNTESGENREIVSRIIVNAAGPWVDQVLKTVFGRNDAKNVRLVRGSHIVVRKKFDHDRCYFFQNADSRIIFAIPYEEDYTLIGTTDVDHGLEMGKPEITPDEKTYLCRMASEYFEEPVAEDDVVWTYSGVRPLFDDGASAARAATRDYVLRQDPALGNGTLMNVFGGKITTYRRLAESMLEEIEKTIGKKRGKWTAGVALPGGDFPVDGYETLVAESLKKHPYLGDELARRLVRHYGTEIDNLLDGVASKKDLGRDFGGTLYESEVRYLMEFEWARRAEDVVFRRTRVGIGMSEKEITAIDDWMAAHVRGAVTTTAAAARPKPSSASGPKSRAKPKAKAGKT